jgi:hypothetical protein
MLVRLDCRPLGRSSIRGSLGSYAGCQQRSGAHFEWYAVAAPGDAGAQLCQTATLKIEMRLMPDVSNRQRRNALPPQQARFSLAKATPFAGAPRNLFQTRSLKAPQAARPGRLSANQ